jgi:hypothetical protein
MLRTNVALMRAFLSFAYVFILSSYWARISRIHLFCFVLLLYTLYNPYLLISSRWLVLSCAWVWWLIHIPIVLQKKSLVHTCSAALRTFIALAGPLLFLTHTANILTIVLSPFAGLLAMLITRTSLALTVFPFLDYIWLTKLLFYEVKSLCSLAEFGSSHGIFITSQDQPIIILLCVWIWLRSIQRHTMIALNRHYYANIRD